MRALLFVVAVSAASMAVAQEPTGRNILEQTVNRRAYKDAALEVQIKKTSKTGRIKTIDLVIFQKNYPEMTNTLVRVEAPDEARGISFLTWDYSDTEKPDEKWFFLPALNQYQKVSEKGKAYEDRFGFSMDIFSINLDEAEHTLLREEDVEGVACYKIESIMKDPRNPEGARVLTWVRKDNLLAARARRFSLEGDMISEFNLTEHEKTGGIWYEKAGIYSEIEKGRSLEFNITGAKYNCGIKDEIFLSSSNPREAQAP